MPDPRTPPADDPAMSAMPAHAVAVVGLAGRFPGARDLHEFWQQAAAGVEVLEAPSEADLDAAGVPAELRGHPDYVRRGTFLERCEEFDAAFFGLSPREAQVLDPQHRVFLECAWEALEHAGYAPGGLPDSVGVFAGASMNTWLHAEVLRNPALAEAAGAYQLMLGNDKDFLCTRVSYKLGLKGPSVTVQTACSTSLVAVQMACRALQRGECDMALAGGVSILFPQRTGYLYQPGMILSPDGHCRPFDARAQGTRTGAGAGIVVLKRLDQALADGDTVHAVIRGIAVNNDGADKAGFTAPSLDGQVEVIATAQALAGVNARSIGYVEAHGTATPLGDPIEIAALTQAFRGDTADVGFCRLGSLKANLGHLDVAAGVAGLIKTVLALSHRTLPPLVHFERPNPALKLESSPFTASATAAPWSPPAGEPRRAGVSSFGIGGTNAHAVLEEAPVCEPRADDGAPQLLVLSARSEAALGEACRRLATHLEAHPEVALADVAHTLQVGRQAFAHRRALVARSQGQAVAALRGPAVGGVLSGRHDGGARPVAFLFSGQGSQHARMGRGLYESQPAYRDAIDRCAALLQPQLGVDLRDLLFAEGDVPALHETRFTQAALFVTEYALAMAWRAMGVEPVAMIGHSLGELVAAHLAGVMSLADALSVVAVRGRLMQQQAAGRMAAVHLAPAELPAWLEAGLEVAAVNAPRLCTIAGPAAAIEAMLTRLAQAGIDARALHTSHAFHSEMMAPAMAPFEAALARITLSPPTRRFVSNVSGTWITAAQATSPAYWAEHLRRPVQFEAGLGTLAADPSLLWLEVGPGQALATLARMNAGTAGAEAARRIVASMRRPDEARGDAEAFLEAAAKLWLAGCRIGGPRAPEAPDAGLPGTAAASRPRRVPLPTYPFERQRYAVEGPPVVMMRAPRGATATSTANAAHAAAGPVPKTDRHGITRSERIDDWFYAPTWARDDRVPDSAPGTPPRWLVLGYDADPLTAALVHELGQRGCVVLRADAGERFETLGPDRWRMPVDAAEDLPRLLGAACRTPLTGIVHLWSLPPRPVAGDTALPWPLRAHEPCYDGLVALALALPERGATAPLRLLHATLGGESVLGEAVASVTQALATGPALVLPREIPGLQVRSVDLEPGPQDDASWHRAAVALADETQQPGVEPQVAHRAGLRWVRRYERIALPPPAAIAGTPWRQQGCYLVTGGLGGMGLAIARWLGQHVAARLVLTSRRPLPPREAWDAWIAQHGTDDPLAQAMAAVRDIEQHGGEVLLADADVADESAMARVLAEARARFGPLHGVIHAAGVAGRGSIARRSDAEQARAVFAPKLGGLQVLRRLLGEQPLDLFVLMSSISAALPAPGVCDYAAANAVLDAFVDSRERPAAWRQVAAIGWGAWRDVGMAARLAVPEALRAQWAAHVAGAIPPAAGLEALARVLASKRRRVIVETYDVVRSHEVIRAAAETAGEAGAGATPSTAIDRVADAPASSARPGAPGADAAQGVAARPSGTAAASSRPSLSTPYVAPSNDIERRLAAIWEEVLGVRGIGVHDDFFELGGHSLMFTRVLALVDEGFGAKLPLRDVFDASTVRLLSERLPTTARAGAAAGGDAAPAEEAPREVLEI